MVYDAMLNYGPLWIIMVKGGVLDPIDINNVPLVFSLVCNFSSFTLKASKGVETLFAYIYIRTYIYIHLTMYLVIIYLSILSTDGQRKSLDLDLQSLKRTAKNAKPSAVNISMCKSHHL